MNDGVTDDDRELLDALGVEPETVQSGGRSPAEQRIIAGFEEIERFVDEQGRLPDAGLDRDIFERMYAVRLAQIRASAECRGILRELDTRDLLAARDDGNEVTAERVKEEASDEALLASLGVMTAPTDDLTQLVHVRSRDEIKAAEEVAQRNPCADFEKFKPIFDRVQCELDAGERRTIKYQDNAEVKRGDTFILDGQKVIVADAAELFLSDYGRPDRRLRVIYDNGTESDLLVRSLQRALNKDKSSRRVTDPNLGPLFAEEAEADDLPTGFVYVLRSESGHPFVAQHRSVIHKIGVTGGDVKGRIANARKDPTYLLAPVEIVATFKLLNVHRKRLEALLHRFLASARLDFELQDRFGAGVEPREWFLVPLPVIEEAIEKIKDGTIGMFRYDRQLAMVVAA